MDVTQKLTNEQLELRLKEFVKKERFLLHIILDHIREVDRRKLYLERAYSSLFEYLVKELGYSGSAALRRQEAARLIVDIPGLGKKIQDGSINLTQTVELSKAIKLKEKINFDQTQSKELSRITTSDKVKLINEIEGKSAPETQNIISRSWNLPIKKIDCTKTQKDHSVRLELTLSRAQHAKLLKCRDLAAHKLWQQNQDLSWASILDLLADQYLKSFIPASTKKHQKTLRKTAVHAIAKLLTDRPIGNSPSASTEHSEALSIKSPTHVFQKTAPSDQIAISNQDVRKSIPQKQRYAIFNRDQRCQYKDPLTQRICGSTLALQIDHKIPIWSKDFLNIQNQQKLNESGNLQVLCAKHNQYKYKKECNLH